MNLFWVVLGSFNLFCFVFFHNVLAFFGSPWLILACFGSYFVSLGLLLGFLFAFICFVLFYVSFWVVLCQFMSPFG